MRDDYLVVDFPSDTQIDFQIDDYCWAFGERFSIIEKIIPTFQKGIFYYNFKLYNTYRELEKVKAFLFSGTRDLTQSDFSYTCSPLQLVQLIVNNLNAIQTHNWAVGTVISGDVKTISISNQNCLELLSSAASEWQTEWYVKGFTVNLARRTYIPASKKILDLGTGLKSAEPEQDSTERAITRLYAFGGAKNLPAEYGSARLKMDVPFLEIAAHSVIEDVQVFDHIYPRRTGAISSIRQSESGIYFFTDAGIDFDPNALQIDGMAKHIIFKSGALIGLDFEVNYKIREEIGEFEIIQYQEASGDIIPSPSLAPSAGDTYILYNIRMPETYVIAAQDELKTEAQAFFDEHIPNKKVFNIELDDVVFASNNLTLEPGEEVTLKHSYIDALKNGLDIRITQFKRYLNNPNRFDSVKVSDTVLASPITSVQNKLDDIENVIDRSGLSNESRMRRSWRDIAEIATMVNAIIARMLLIGDEQGQFTLPGVVFTANAGGNPNSFTATAGQLIHKTVPDEETPGTWSITAFSDILQSESTFYYLYAKCTRATSEGVLIFSPTEITYDSDPDYWHFFIGGLSSLHLYARTFKTAYGFTLISGNQIETGVVKSADGSCVVDLSGNRIIFGDADSEFSWNKDGNKKVKIKGLITVSQGGGESPVGAFLGAWYAGIVCYAGDTVTYEGSTWRYIFATPSGTGTPAPSEGQYWTCVGAAGSDGVDGAGVEFIFTRNNTGATPATPTGDPAIDDYVPTGWTDNMQGVTSVYPFEFVSKRTKTAGVWSVFSVPKLWSRYSY
ncbi:MAG: hypothetical protein ABFD76_15130, partial [Smithella sp.]